MTPVGGGAEWDAFVYKENSEAYPVSVPLSGKGSLPIANGIAGSGTTIVSWKTDEGILLGRNLTGAKATDYKATITWSLQQVPLG